MRRHARSAAALQQASSATISLPPCEWTNSHSGIVGVLLDLELGRLLPPPRTSPPEAPLAAAQRISSHWKYHDAVTPHTAGIVPAMVQLVPPPLQWAEDMQPWSVTRNAHAEQTDALKRQLVGCMGLQAAEMADLMGVSSSLSPQVNNDTDAASQAAHGAVNRTAIVQQLRGASPGEWRALSALLGPIPTQTVFAAIGVNPAFSLGGDVLAVAHSELLQLIRQRHAALIATPPERKPDAILLDSGCLRGLRKVYLRALRVVEFCSLQRIVVELQQSLNAKLRASGRAAEAELDEEQLEFFAVMPARRECTLDKTEQWSAVLSNLGVALPLVKRKSNLLRMTANVALFLRPRGAVLRVRELLGEICTIADHGGHIPAVELHESVTAVVSAALNKLQTAKLKDISETLDVLALAVAVKGRVPAEGLVDTEHVRLELAKSDTSPFDSDAAAQCLPLVEGIAAQLLAVIPVHVADLDRKRGLAKSVMAWIDAALLRMPTGSVRFTSLQLPRIAKLLVGPAYESAKAKPYVAFSWQCGCGALNVAGNVNCIECTVEHGEPSAKCSKPNCGAQLSAKATQCGTCDAEHPHHAVARKHGEWHCAECSRQCALGFACEECGEQDPQQPVPCDGCGAEIARSTTVCGGCGHAYSTLEVQRCGECCKLHITTKSGSAVPMEGSCSCSEKPDGPRLPYAQWRCGEGCGTLNSPASLGCRACSSTEGSDQFTCGSCGEMTQVPTAAAPPAAVGGPAAPAAPVDALAACGSCGELHPREAAFAEKAVTQCPGCHEVTPIASPMCTRCGQVPIAQMRAMLPKFSVLPWGCHQCGTRNQNAKGRDPMVCSGCGVDRISVTLFAETDVWTCRHDRCGQANNRGLSCKRCSALHPNVPRESVFVWGCGRCQMPNHSWDTLCRRTGCGATNPALRPKATAAAVRKEKDGDAEEQNGSEHRRYQHAPWKCGECGRRNRALNVTRCFHCKVQRPKPKCGLCGEHHLSHRCPARAHAERQRRLEELLMESFHSSEPSVDDVLAKFARERPELTIGAQLELPLFVP